MDSPLIGVILIVILIVLNGIFSCGEFAIVSSRKSRIKEMVKEQKEKNADKLLQMKENPERFLSAVQIGITLFGTLASAIGGAISLKYIVPVARGIPVISSFAEPVSLAFVVIVLTYLFLVFGELVPKYIGLNYREKAGLRIAPLFEFTSRVFFFFVNFLTFSSMGIVRAFNLKKGEEHIGEGEIKLLLEEGRRKGVFGKTEEDLIHGVFDFADTSVKEVMVPKPNIYAINVEENKEQIITYMVENEFSRYPVYRDYLDNIVGIVYHKDITKQIWLKEPFDLEKVLNKPYFVTDTMKIRIVLKEMQKRHQHMAIVVDEFGIVAGIVTLEDIMEEIFGEIMDETDVDEGMQRLSDGSVLIDASFSIRDLNNRLNLTLAESPDYETLGGFILAELQGIARGGEIIHNGPYKLTVVGIDGRRITKVKLEKTKKQRSL
jgi:putative hemolysin